MPTSIASTFLRHRWEIPIALAIGTIACGVTTPWVGAPRPVADLPDRFVIDTAALGGAPAPATTSTCMVHLIDHQTGTRLRLVHSARQGNQGAGVLMGDYAVEPPRRYGLLTGEGLRVNCESGQALGAVPLNER
jgi:hypothetical protein